jgi:hypothetical protein
VLVVCVPLLVIRMRQVKEEVTGETFIE